MLKDKLKNMLVEIIFIISDVGNFKKNWVRSVREFDEGIGMFFSL